MKSFTAVFVRGLITLLPIALTIYVLYSTVILLENLLAPVLRYTLGENYLPGIGFCLTLILIYFFGLLLNNLIITKVLYALEESIKKVPFIRTIYSPLRDLMNLFKKNNKREMGQVVLANLGGMKAMGLVTREDFKDLGMAMTDQVAVYIPMSYGLGGFTLLMPKRNLERLNLPVEKAMSLAITAWVASSDHQVKGDVRNEL